MNEAHRGKRIAFESGLADASLDELIPSLFRCKKYLARISATGLFCTNTTLPFDNFPILFVPSELMLSN